MEGQITKILSNYKKLTVNHRKKTKFRVETEEKM